MNQHLNDRPWMTALEMQFAACRLIRAENFRRGTEYREAAISQRELGHLRRAETYSWSRETTHACMLASKSIPNETRLSLPLMPTGGNCGWWWTDAPFNGPTKLARQTGEKEITVLVHGLLFSLEVGPNGSQTVAFRAFSHSPDWLVEGHAPKGAPDGFGSWLSWSMGLDESIAELEERGKTQVRKDDWHIVIPAVSKMTRFFLAGCTWLRQRVVVSTLGPIERHRRKQIAREHDAVVSDVKVVQLRRTETRETLDATTAVDHIDWSCRWIVNGHWRNQPYKEGSKLIYIMPFVKGPADKPLKVPTHTVYAVNR